MSQCVLMLVAWLLVFAGTASGAIYTYRDAQGRLHFTNNLNQVPAAYRDQAAASRRSELPPTTRTATPPARSLTPPPPSPTVESVPLSPPPQRTKRPALPSSRSVNTRKLALIRIGMSSEEVQKRLGPPAKVIILSSGEKWVYPGSRQTPPAFVIFYNDKVNSRGRVGEEGRTRASDFTYRKY